MQNTDLIYGIAAIVFAALVAFTTTPLARVLAYKFKAIDVPTDGRRMHSKPIPRLGGLAIFIAYIVTTAIFCEISPALLALWAGGLCIVILGMLDDIFRLKAIIKLVAQIAIAFVPVLFGLKIDFFNLFGNYINLGVLSIPITVIWIVGLTNAINLIDGLDGLSCGVSAICSLSLLLVALTASDASSALLTAVLVGSCVGFLPFNSNPAKIFMGDTGALFLGYSLSILSIQGLFKLNAILSFIIPLSIFGLPLFDTAFAIIRRIVHGKSPFAPDRGHIHHKLIDMGFNQKQSVYILYAICGILGISSLLLARENYIGGIITIVIGFSIFAINYLVIKNSSPEDDTLLSLEKERSMIEDKLSDAGDIKEEDK